jgi:hypothetical protein
MPDYRIISELIDRLPPLPADDDWTARWCERNRSVHAVLGETAEPGMVYSFSWKDRLLPGACALAFKPTSVSKSFLYMTLGLTQPLRATESAHPWEFAVRAKEHTEWPVDLLYQLLTQWSLQKGKMWFGYHLPLTFFIGHDGKMWASIAERVQHRQVVGSIRGLYLWTDASRLRFKVAGGEFGLLVVVGVTEDEDRLARETSPAHLMLLLRRMGVDQVCDPHRPSVLLHPTASEEWASIKGMSHDDAFNELQAAT